MVEVPDTADTPADSNSGWWFAGLFTVAAIVGVWWAEVQQSSIQEFSGSTFQMPAARWILWSLTLITVGACIGLAVAAAANWHQRIPVAGLLWGLVPLVPVLSFHVWINGLMGFPSSYLRIAISLGSQTACSIFVGVFIAGLLTQFLPRTAPVGSAPPQDA